MKIPNKLKIGGFDWTIREDKALASECGAYGMCRFDDQEIVLDPATTQQNKEESFIHEVIHAILWQTGFRRIFDKVEGLTEEEIVKCLGHSLYQVLKDNDLRFYE